MKVYCVSNKYLSQVMEVVNGMIRNQVRQEISNQFIMMLHESE
jgi:hypothetical protein